MATLNRLFREKFDEGERTCLPRLEPGTCAISQEHWPLQGLLDLNGLKLTEKQPDKPEGPVIVAKYEGRFYCIDGRRRISQWKREQNQGAHSVLIVAPN